MVQGKLLSKYSSKSTKQFLLEVSVASIDVMLANVWMKLVDQLQQKLEVSESLSICDEENEKTKNGYIYIYICIYIYIYIYTEKCAKDLGK